MGSTTDGTIFSGDLREPQLAPLPRYPDDPDVPDDSGDAERTTAIGMRADKRGNLVVAGGGTGKIFVLSTADGSTRKVLDTGLRTRDNTFLNDVAIFKGYAYITDSVAPVLYRVRLGKDGSIGELETFWTFGGTAFAYTAGFNANGIVIDKAGR